MKKYVVSLALLLTLGLLAGLAFAEEAEGPRKGRRKDRAKHMAKPGQRLGKELGLTEDQQKQFSQIMETHRQAVENWQKEHGEALKDLHKQMREAMKAKDKEKAQSIREKMKKQFEARKGLGEGLMKRLGEVLTEEQLAKFKKSFGPRPDRGREGPAGHPIIRGLAALRAAELTPQQQAKVNEILDGAMKKITDEVLTAEQREKLKKPRERGERKGERDRPRRPRKDRGKKGGNQDTVKVQPAE